MGTCSGSPSGLPSKGWKEGLKQGQSGEVGTGGRGGELRRQELLGRDQLGSKALPPGPAPSTQDPPPHACTPQVRRVLSVPSCPPSSLPPSRSPLTPLIQEIWAPSRQRGPQTQDITAEGRVFCHSHPTRSLGLGIYGLSFSQILSRILSFALAGQGVYLPSLQPPLPLPWFLIWSIRLEHPEMGTSAV